MQWLTLASIAVLVVAAGYLIWRSSRTTSATSKPRSEARSARDVSKLAGSLTEAAGALNERMETCWHPKQLLEDPLFARGLELIREQNHSTEDFLVLAFSENKAIACLSLHALKSQASCGPMAEAILVKLDDLDDWPRFFALGLLDACVPAPASLIGKVLTRLNLSYQSPQALQFLRQFLKDRLNGGEKPEATEELRTMTDDKLESVRNLLAALDTPAASYWSDRVRELAATRVNCAFLNSIGSVWPPATHNPDLFVEHERVLADALRLESFVLGDQPRSVIMVGENGVGKTTLFRLVAERLQIKGWTVFQAGHSELVAGKSYIGEFEQSMKALIGHLGGRKIVWYIPDFHAIAWAGRHQYSPSGALDYILPQVEDGRIVVVGETEPAAYESLIQHKARCRTAFESLRIEPLPAAETLALARRWCKAVDEAEARPGSLDETVLQEAWQLAQQYLGEKSSPGNLFEFLRRTRQRAIHGLGRESTNIDDFVAVLSVLTGLPENILDERQQLSLEALRRFFEKRVLGQPEAIDCLVDRISMIKAGVTDPTRPQGVFMFAGPTGTGKTEIAKALAEYLFGSPQRMIRLDMSEFQAPGSLDRLLGEENQRESAGALVDQIRKQPFSVVLLDECEKAHFTVWDLFLQVFDDGRLTDRRGRTADFRHAIFILTSNLGAVVRMGESPGFLASELGTFSRAAVAKAISNAFRKEFLNRIDRVIIFQPLGREIMKEILRKELDEVFRRRGLRNRSWAVEWDDAALEFLLEKGFTPDLGARPVKRAVERYLLAPLAKTIVGHQFPEGDQFLFVNSDGVRLTVDFVDPDAEEPCLDTDRIPQPTTARTPPAIAFQPEGSAGDLACLHAHYQSLLDMIGNEEWHERKRAALESTNSPDFWTSDTRFKVLGLAEYLDRIETGMKTAGSLLNRLRTTRTARSRYPRDVVERLAQQIYLLEKACSGLVEGQPRDAFLLVEALRGSEESATLADEFAARLGRMYREWARKRRMQAELLDEVSPGAHAPYRLILAASGFGAYSILSPEDGLHVFELPRSGGRLGRLKTLVRVAGQPDEPPADRDGGLRRQAEAALCSLPAPRSDIVRRYREQPSPLIRDSVRGWRTGHLNRVWSGDFDLIVAVTARA
jgi:ATP-dependent Clp protease ATP-binding subunit ClpC